MEQIYRFMLGVFFVIVFAYNELYPKRIIQSDISLIKLSIYIFCKNMELILVVFYMFYVI